MRITIVTGPFLACSSDSIGAVEKLWYRLALEFVALGHDITIVTKSSISNNISIISEKITFKKTTGFSRTGVLILDLILDLLYSIKTLLYIPKSDVLVTNTFFLPIFTSLYKSKFGKIVVAVHRYPQKQMFLYRRADRLSVVSNAVADQILKQTPNLSHLIKVIPNPVDTNIFNYVISGREHLSTPRFLYAGRIHPEKGLHILVSAFRQVASKVPGVSLTILGPWKTDQGGGGLDYLEKLKKESMDLNLSFEMAITDPFALAKRMAESDVFCYPSVATNGEAFGIAPLEAMALGKLTIISNLECFNQYAINGENCLIFELDGINSQVNLSNSMLEAISYLRSGNYINVNASRTAKKFSYKKIANYYIDDWQKLVSSVDTK